MKNNFRILLITIWLLVIFAAGASIHFNAQAQDGDRGAWGEVVNNDGSINYDGMTDNGVVSQPADFMPTIPGVGQLNAEYHAYTTESGNQVLMPSATTLFFMATDSSSMLYSNPSMGTTPIGISGAESSQGSTFVGIAALGNLFSDAFQTGGQYDTSFFNSVISGDQDIWQVAPTGIGDLFFSFMDTSFQDFNLYTYMILVPPDACASSPAGCGMEDLVVETPPPPTEPPPDDIGDDGCPAPAVIPGKITFDGSKTAPEYPLVVGQDPDKRGVDFTFSASVAPTKYITYRMVLEYSCDADTECGPGNPRVVTGFHCVQNVETFPECIASAGGTIRLTDASRKWILEELSIRYPEAYLHDPEMRVASGGECVWSEEVENVPVADPGYWDLFVRGRTSGTPVSGPRGFGGRKDTFEVWLKEIAIIK
jgi:hypothetical protein